MGPTLFPTVFWCDRGCGSDTPSRRKAYRGCHVPRARKRAWLGSLSPCGPSLSFGVGLRLDAFFRAYPSKSGSVNLPSLSGEIPHGHGWNAPPKSQVRSRLLAGGRWIRTLGPSLTTSARIGLKRRKSFVRKVRDACAPVKCSGGAAILRIEWLDGDQRHARTLYRNPTRHE